MPSPKFSYNIDYAIAANKSFRSIINDKIGRAWMEKSIETKKNFFFENVNENVEILGKNTLLYLNSSCELYDFINDKVGDVILDQHLEPKLRFIEKKNKDFFIEICYDFKNVIENNNGSMLLRKDTGKPREEKFTQ